MALVCQKQRLLRSGRKKSEFQRYYGGRRLTVGQNHYALKYTTVQPTPRLHSCGLIAIDLCPTEILDTPHYFSVEWRRMERRMKRRMRLSRAPELPSAQVLAIRQEKAYYARFGVALQRDLAGLQTSQLCKTGIDCLKSQTPCSWSADELGTRHQSERRHLI